MASESGFLVSPSLRPRKSCPSDSSESSDAEEQLPGDCHAFNLEISEKEMRLMTREELFRKYQHALVILTKREQQVQRLSREVPVAPSPEKVRSGDAANGHNGAPCPDTATRDDDLNRLRAELESTGALLAMAQASTQHAWNVSLDVVVELEEVARGAFTGFLEYLDSTLRLHRAGLIGFEPLLSPRNLIPQKPVPAVMVTSSGPSLSATVARMRPAKLSEVDVGVTSDVGMGMGERVESQLRVLSPTRKVSSPTRGRRSSEPRLQVPDFSSGVFNLERRESRPDFPSIAKKVQTLTSITTLLSGNRGKLRGQVDESTEALQDKIMKKVVATVEDEAVRNTLLSELAKIHESTRPAPASMPIANLLIAKQADLSSDPKQGKVKLPKATYLPDLDLRGAVAKSLQAGDASSHVWVCEWHCSTHNHRFMANDLVQHIHVHHGVEALLDVESIEMDLLNDKCTDCHSHFPVAMRQHHVCSMARRGRRAAERTQREGHKSTSDVPFSPWLWFDAATPGSGGAARWLPLWAEDCLRLEAVYQQALHNFKNLESSPSKIAFSIEEEGKAMKNPATENSVGCMRCHGHIRIDRFGITVCPEQLEEAARGNSKMSSVTVNLSVLPDSVRGLGMARDSLAASYVNSPNSGTLYVLTVMRLPVVRYGAIMPEVVLDMVDEFCGPQGNFAKDTAVRTSTRNLNRRLTARWDKQFMKSNWEKDRRRFAVDSAAKIGPECVHYSGTNLHDHTAELYSKEMEMAEASTSSSRLSFVQRFLYRRDKKTDESLYVAAPLLLYTMDTPLFRVVNKALRMKSEGGIKIHKDYIWLLSEVLKVLPCYVGSCYRGLDTSVSESLYSAGQIITWQAFSSATSNAMVAAQFFLNKDDEKRSTLFMVRSSSARAISTYSFNRSEEEVLFAPNTQFRVRGKMGVASKELLEGQLSRSLANVDIYELDEVSLNSYDGLYKALTTEERNNPRNREFMYLLTAARDQDTRDARRARLRGTASEEVSYPLCVSDPATGNTLVHLSAAEANPVLLQVMLASVDVRASGELVEQTNMHGQTALHLACGVAGNQHVVEKLLTAGANPLLLDHNGDMALDIAARIPGNAETIQLLLSAYDFRATPGVVPILTRDTSDEISVRYFRHVGNAPVGSSETRSHVRSRSVTEYKPSPDILLRCLKSIACYNVNVLKEYMLMCFDSQTGLKLKLGMCEYASLLASALSTSPTRKAAVESVLIFLLFVPHVNIVSSASVSAFLQRKRSSTGAVDGSAETATPPGPTGGLASQLMNPTLRNDRQGEQLRRHIREMMYIQVPSLLHLALSHPNMSPRALRSVFTGGWAHVLVRPLDHAQFPSLIEKAQGMSAVHCLALNSHLSAAEALGWLVRTMSQLYEKKTAISEMDDHDQRISSFLGNVEPLAVSSGSVSSIHHTSRVEQLEISQTTMARVMRDALINNQSRGDRPSFWSQRMGGLVHAIFRNCNSECIKFVIHPIMKLAHKNNPKIFVSGDADNRLPVHLMSCHPRADVLLATSVLGTKQLTWLCGAMGEFMKPPFLDAQGNTALHYICANPRIGESQLRGLLMFLSRRDPYHNNSWSTANTGFAGLDNYRLEPVRLLNTYLARNFSGDTPLHLLVGRVRSFSSCTETDLAAFYEVLQVVFAEALTICRLGDETNKDDLAALQLVANQCVEHCAILLRPPNQDCFGILLRKLQELRLLQRSSAHMSMRILVESGLERAVAATLDMVEKLNHNHDSVDTCSQKCSANDNSGSAVFILLVHDKNANSEYSTLFSSEEGRSIARDNTAGAMLRGITDPQREHVDTVTTSVESDFHTVGASIDAHQTAVFEIGASQRIAQLRDGRCATIKGTNVVVLRPDTLELECVIDASYSGYPTVVAPLFINTCVAHQQEGSITVTDVACNRVIIGDSLGGLTVYGSETVGLWRPVATMSSKLPNEQPTSLSQDGGVASPLQDDPDAGFDHFPTMPRGPVVSIASTETTIAALYFGGQVRIWNAGLAGVCPCPENTVCPLIAAFASVTHSVGESRGLCLNDNFLAVAGGPLDHDVHVPPHDTIRIFDLVENKLLRVIHPNMHTISFLNCGKHGEMLFVAGHPSRAHSSLAMFDMRSGELMWEFISQLENIVSVSISSDDPWRALVIGASNTVNVVELMSGNVTCILRPPPHLQLKAVSIARGTLSHRLNRNTIDVGLAASFQCGMVLSARRNHMDVFKVIKASLISSDAIATVCAAFAQRFFDILGHRENPDVSSPPSSNSVPSATSALSSRYTPPDSRRLPDSESEVPIVNILSLQRSPVEVALLSAVATRGSSQPIDLVEYVIESCGSEIGMDDVSRAFSIASPHIGFRDLISSFRDMQPQSGFFLLGVNPKSQIHRVIGSHPSIGVHVSTLSLPPGPSHLQDFWVSCPTFTSRSIVLDILAGCVDDHIAAFQVKDPMMQTQNFSFVSSSTRAFPLDATPEPESEFFDAALHPLVSFSNLLRHALSVSPECCVVLLPCDTPLHRTRDGNGNTLLHLAVAAGAFRIVEYLVWHDQACHNLEARGFARSIGTDSGTSSSGNALFMDPPLTTIRNYSGRLPLDFAIERDDGTSARLLLDGLSEKLLSQPLRCGHPSPLSWFAQRGDTDTCIRLLESGANPSVCGDDGVTALHKACMLKGQLHLIQTLCKYGAELDAVDSTGRGAFFYAVRAGDTEIATWLASAGAPTNVLPHDGDTLLHAAARERGNEEMIKYLLESGLVSVHDVDATGRTALSVAVATGDVDIVRYLLASGAEICDFASMLALSDHDSAGDLIDAISPDITYIVRLGQTRIQRLMPPHFADSSYTPQIVFPRYGICDLVQINSGSVYYEVCLEEPGPMNQAASIAGWIVTSTIPNNRLENMQIWGIDMVHLTPYVYTNPVPPINSHADPDSIRGRLIGLRLSFGYSPAGDDVAVMSFYENGTLLSTNFVGVPVKTGVSPCVIRHGGVVSVSMTGHLLKYLPEDCVPISEEHAPQAAVLNSFMEAASPRGAISKGFESSADAMAGSSTSAIIKTTSAPLPLH